MIQFIPITFFGAIIFVLFYIKEREQMHTYLARGCMGFRWRRQFPQASNPEIREFLNIFIEAFGFKQSWRLYFAPNDRVMDVYRILNPIKNYPDNMELETLVMDLQKRYQVDIAGSWREDITLAELFAQTRHLVS